METEPARHDFGSTAVRVTTKQLKNQKRHVPRLSQPFPTRGFTYSLVDLSNTWHSWRKQVRTPSNGRTMHHQGVLPVVGLAC